MMMMMMMIANGLHSAYTIS